MTPLVPIRGYQADTIAVARKLAEETA